MAEHTCYIIPPHLLEAMSESSDTQAKELANRTIASVRNIHRARHEFFAAKLNQAQQRHHRHNVPGGQSIIPDALLEHISNAADVDDSTKKQAAKSLSLSQQMRDGRTSDQPQQGFAAEAAAPKDDSSTGFHRGVYTMAGKGDDEDQVINLLPGDQVRLEGQAPSKDNVVNEAYDNALKVLEFYKKVFNYTSLDNKNMPVVSSVHFAKDFGNAFWTSEQQQMVYGDGNALIHNFTACLDVIGHEMTHAVTGFNSGLQYQGESGALNEHISDAFGIMVKQMSENTTAKDSDWLIGEGCLMPNISGVALRNMIKPGTAYSDPKLGSDIQPANYNDIPAVMKKNGPTVERDSGGVHIFSGIPNRAFALAAIAFGGYTWEKAGQVWWKTVTSGAIPPNCNFIQFADATVDKALELYGEDGAKTVRSAWNEVGVVRKH